MFDTKTNFLSYVDTKLWPFKSWRYQKIAKFWKAHNTPPRGPRAKKFWFSKFLPRGYLHAKNDQNRWDKGVKLLWSALEWAMYKTIFWPTGPTNQNRPTAKIFNFCVFRTIWMKFGMGGLVMDQKKKWNKFEMA